MTEKYNFDAIINRIGTDSLKWNSLQGKFGSNDLLPFWVADMDFSSPRPVIDALKARVEHGIFGYVFRDDAFSDAVISWFATQHKWLLLKEWISFSPGVVTGLTIMIRAFTNIGDKIVIQPPVYYPFSRIIRQNNRVVEENPLCQKHDGKYEIDFADLERKLKEPSVKAMILCSPHNPVSRVWRKEELLSIGNLCKKYGVIIFSDEIHCDFVFGSRRHIPLASLSDEIANNTVTLVSPSKTFNLAGLKTAVIISKNKNLLDRYNEMLDIHHVAGPNCFGLVATEAAYTHGEEYRKQLLEYLQTNIAFLSDYISRRIPILKVTEPEGTYLMWIDCRALALSNDELDDLFFKKAKIAVDAGHWFGSSGSGFMRINIACPRSILEKGLCSLHDAVASLGGRSE
ncbi:MalY/PatB family protein [Sediminispirochaeta bajacaliforniensis]|uniref:MalY/PatB family protein n=1 Tax=Sediminispirochaeta bajacaliforniensis TaxID=148 RepID=UPI000360505A|nr:MalY/PatB family protein [Sediminispirochaeta bajacaliforniensis]